MATLELYDYQKKMLGALRNGFNAGHKVQMLYAPCGGGKTELAIAMMDALGKRGLRSTMLLDLTNLCEQTSKRLSKYGIDHGVIMPQSPRYNTELPIQVAMIQTIEARKFWPKTDLLIIDEAHCFAADTEIATLKGNVKISNVRCGDMVYNALGIGKVEKIMSKQSNDIYMLEYENGTTIECTGGHPFFTEKGWVNASKMEVGRASISQQGLSLLWGNIPSKNMHGKWEASCSEFPKEMGRCNSLLSILLKEDKEPDGQYGIKGKNGRNSKKNRVQTENTRRERARFISSSSCNSSNTWGWMGGGSGCSNKNAALEDWLSYMLQAGLGEQGYEDWHRDRREKPQVNSEERSRLEKDRILYFPRLVNISRKQRECGINVFNLQVSGHPSYFADGMLVHNCTRSSVIEFIKSNPDMEVVGLSGSPFTKWLGATYTNVVSRVTVNSLVEKDKLILPMVYIAKPIDMKGAKKNTFGEWTNKEVAERGAKITGDIVSEWESKTKAVFGGPAKTIVFCAGVDHGKDLAERFAAKGFTFIALSHKSDPQYRADAMEEFAKPDSFIHGLIATDLLTKGFDQTDISVMISARPFTKSFSSHVQQIGRIMRVHSSKDKALLLDHSGNYLRHREQWDDVCENGVHVLNDVSEEAKKEPTDKEKEAAKCPKCGLLWPANADMCACGYVRERRNSVSELAGEMFELVGKKEKKEKFSMEQKTDFYAMSIQYRILKGYKKGWEFFNYKKKFGVEPSMKTPSPKPLDDDFRNWITHLAMQNKYKKAA